MTIQGSKFQYYTIFKNIQGKIMENEEVARGGQGVPGKHSIMRYSKTILGRVN